MTQEIMKSTSKHPKPLFFCLWMIQKVRYQSYLSKYRNGSDQRHQEAHMHYSLHIFLVLACLIFPCLDLIYTFLLCCIMSNCADYSLSLYFVFNLIFIFYLVRIVCMLHSICQRKLNLITNSSRNENTMHEVK